MLWSDCSQLGNTRDENINAVAVDPSGRLWVATEQAGVAMLDEAGWHRFTTRDGLPSLKTYGIVFDARRDVWVATWGGVARFDGKMWTVPYTAENQTLFNDHVHALAF